MNLFYILGNKFDIIIGNQVFISSYVLIHRVLNNEILKFTIYTYMEFLIPVGYEYIK